MKPSKTKSTKKPSLTAAPTSEPIDPAPPKKPRHCEHVKANGEFCGSPALRGRNYCYFHLTYIGRRLRAAGVHDTTSKLAIPAQFIPIDVPLLEAGNSVQLALTQIVNALLHNDIDIKRAGLALYALQIASSNLANSVDLSQARDATVAGSYDDFEQDYHLPANAPELRAGNVDEKDQQEEAAEIADSTPRAARSARPPNRSQRSVPPHSNARIEHPARNQFLEITPSLLLMPADKRAAPAPAVGPTAA